MRLWFFIALLLTAFAASVEAKLYWQGRSGTQTTAPATITGVALSGNTFTCGTAGIVGHVTVQGVGTSNASLTLTGTDAAQFSLSAANAPADLTVGTSPSGCPRSYSFNIVASQTGASGCDAGTNHCTQAETITGSPPPTGIACDYGPNTTLPTGTAGTDLAASGFTHCIMNADFTDNSGATVGGGWRMNDPTTYIAECKGSNTWGLFWLRWVGGGAGGNDIGPAPCNRASIFNDSGTHVLSFQFGTSDLVSSQTGLTLFWPLCGNPCVGLRPTLQVPLYEEITYELAGGTNQSVNNIINSYDDNTVYDNGPGQCAGGAGGCFLDPVFLETANNGGTSTSLDNYSARGKVPRGGGWTQPNTNYHTYGNLTTSDNISTLVTCFYLDNAPAPSLTPQYGNPTLDGNYCGHWINFNIDGSTELLAHDRHFLMFIGNPSSATIIIRIKSIKIFGCANYRGTGNDCTAAQSGGSIVFH